MEGGIAWVERVREAANTPNSPASRAGFSKRLPLPADNRELVVVEVSYPPGGSPPLHRHPVGGVIYILEGVAKSAYGGDEPRRHRSGETLQDRADIAW